METTVYYAPGGKWSTEEPKVWIYAYGVSDPEEFIEHMKKYHSIPAGPYSRDIYEKVCKEFGVEPVADEDFHPYGMEYGDFGNAHYHTVPENRPLGIANSIHQQRFFGIKKENAAQKKKEDLPPITYGKEGQLWEPCERCGKEPVYMPLHLCDDCWPG